MRKRKRGMNKKMIEKENMKSMRNISEKKRKHENMNNGNKITRKI